MKFKTIKKHERKFLAEISRQVLIVFLISGFGSAKFVFAEEASQPTDKVQSKSVDEAKRVFSLPRKLPGGQSFRSIGISDSQKFELIPPDYSPVKQDKLVEAVTRWAESTAETPDNRLANARYIVRVSGDVLDCESGFLDVSSNGTGWTSQSLGKVGFAIKDSEFRIDKVGDDFYEDKQIADRSGRLVSLSDGTLIAKFNRGSLDYDRIPLRWTLQGNAEPRGYSFDIVFPRSLQTKFLFCVASDRKLVADKGVLGIIDGVPEAISSLDVKLFDRGEQVRWYELDAGGLDSIRLRSVQQQNDSSSEGIVIRRNAIEYNIDSSGLSFIQRMEIGLPVGVSLPHLRVIGAKLTSVKVNASEASFVPLSTATDSTVRRFSLSTESISRTDYIANSPPGAIGKQDTRVSLTLMGQADWGTLCDLPIAGLLVNPDQNIPIVDACVRDEARITMAPVGRIVDWELPIGWERQSTTNLESLNIESAVGTSLFAAFESTMQKGSSEITPWSRLRLSTQPVYRVQDLWLRSQVGESRIDCDAVFQFQLDAQVIEPMRFAIQEGWEIQSILFPFSGRMIETPSIDERLQMLIVWPEKDDIDQKTGDEDTTDAFELRIQISGKCSVGSSGSQIVLPSTWMVRASDQKSRVILSDDFTAAVIPPADMNWVGDTAMMPHRVNRNQLLPAQRQFFDGQDRPVLYFKPRHRQIEALSLESPSVDYQANLSLQIEKRGDEISEQYFVNVNPLGRGLDQLSVHTGPAVGRPPLRWMLPGQGNSPAKSLAASDVSLNDELGKGIYAISVSGLDLSEDPLMAYRSYPARDISLQLPSIPNAVAGTSQLYIDTGLQIVSKSKGVQLVPRTSPPQQRFSSFAEDTRSGSSDQVSGFRFGQSNQFDGLHLRYDSVQKPSIDLKAIDQDVSLNLITHAQTRVIASSRGSDRVETRILAALALPLTIDVDPGLQLVSVTRDGEPVDLATLPRLPLVLPPQRGAGRGGPEAIVLKWNRNQIGFHAIRRCRIPEIDFDAVVLKHEYHLTASADTFAPAAMLSGNSKTTRRRALEMTPNQNTLLIRRNIVLAVGWLIAMINFIVFWLLMKRSPLLVASCLIVVGTSVLLWWPWRTAMIGWFVIPLVAAAMLVAAKSWLSSGSQTPKQDAAHHADVLAGDQAAPQQPSLTEFSWDSMLRSLLFVASMVLPTCQGAVLNAQVQTIPGTDNFKKSEDVTDSDRRVADPINVIIPMDVENRPAGEFVYIPDAFHQRLFEGQARSTLLAPNYVSANYQLKIREKEISTKGFLSASLVATFDLDFMDQSSDDERADGIATLRQYLIALPHQQVEKVQSSGIEPTTFRFTAGPQGGTIVTLPSSQTASIEVTLRLTGSRQGPWFQFVLDIPSISNSRIEVESESDLRVLRIGGLNGHLVEEADLRRWAAVLGPTETLDVSFRVDPRLNSTVAQSPKPLQRRYWVSAGLVTTTVDCEIDPPESFAAGEVFQFVIRDSAMPILVSSDWRLVDTVVYAPRRRRVNVMSVRDSPGPIQLLWRLSNQSNWTTQRSSTGNVSGLGLPAAPFSSGTSVPLDSDSVQIRIPEVIASSLGENAPAWVALRCLDSLAFDPLRSDLIEPLSVDQFLAGWSGYRGRIDRAFVALNEIPSPIFRRLSVGYSKIEDRHRLRVSPERLELSYQADVTPDPNNDQPYVLSIPKGIELVDLYVDEVRQRPFMVDSVGRRNVIIDRNDRKGNTFNLSAFAIGELSPGQQFKPPVMVLKPTSESYSKKGDQQVIGIPGPMSELNRVSSYTVSRTNDSYIQIVEPFAVDATRSVATLTAEGLADGYLPVATWKASSNSQSDLAFDRMKRDKFRSEQGDVIDPTASDKITNEDFWQGNWGGLFRVQHKSARFKCEQLIKLRRIDRDWQVVNQIHFSGQRVPDYIDIEIPTRWCDSLEVSPATAWSRQPSTNNLKQVVRVRCDPVKNRDQPLVISGLLSQKNDGRVSVPAVRVLGSGKRTIFVQVPQRLTSELVQWRKLGVEKTALPNHFINDEIDRDIAEPYTDSEQTEPSDSAAAYRVIRDKWSVDLAPLPELSLQPIATAQDNQVFPAENSFCVISHWDISPGSLEAIRVSIPADAEYLGAWSGGVTVLPKKLSSPSFWKQTDGSETDESLLDTSNRQVLEIPLSLSQLPQSVKLLIRVPASGSKRADYAPRLLEIPVTQSWLAIYQPHSSIHERKPDLASEIAAMRNLSLARSAVESIELAVDIVAERSSDEVVPWVAPWVYRYLQLAAASGREADFLSSGTDNEELDPTRLFIDSVGRFEQVQWPMLDRRVAAYANRYVPDLRNQVRNMKRLQTSILLQPDGKEQGLEGSLGRVGNQNRSQNQSDANLGSDSSESGFDDLVYLGNEAIFSSTSVPGFRLDQVTRLASSNHVIPLRLPLGADTRYRVLLSNVITLTLVIGLLCCLVPLKRYLYPVISHPAFWLAVLGVAGLFVAPSYVALSLILVAISLPQFPKKQKKRTVISE